MEAEKIRRPARVAGYSSDYFSMGVTSMVPNIVIQ
jgi:hypothetical protein